MSESGRFNKLVWIGILRRDSRFTLGERIVVMELGDSANLGGFGAWRSNEQLMEMFDLSRRTVQNARKRAVELGYLVPTKHVNGGRNLTIHYNLSMPKMVTA